MRLVRFVVTKCRWPVTLRCAACTFCLHLNDSIHACSFQGSEGPGLSLRLFNIHLSDPLGSVDWGAASQQASKLVTLFFVVSFGSSLDISAIQADLPVPIDYNAELQTVGANS